MAWALRFAVADGDHDVFAGICFQQGALGVELRAGEVVAHFPTRDAASSAAAAIAPLEPAFRFGRAPEPESTADRDWEAIWRSRFRPVRAGRRGWIHPPWERPALAANEWAVEIAPGEGFGDGSHATTSLCLARLEELLGERPGADVLDVGAGSGVLSLAAARLGAGRIVAVEIMDDALADAHRNERANDLGGRIEWRKDLPDGTFPIVLANIRTDALIDMAVALRRVAGELVLSGIREVEEDAIRDAFGPPAHRSARDGWVCYCPTSPNA